MNETFYYNEFQASLIASAEKAIEKKLYSEELRLACECATQCTAYITLDYKNGKKMYVARNRKWNGTESRYEYVVQLLDNELNVIEQAEYYIRDKKTYRLDGYAIVPLWEIAYKAVRAGR